MLMTYIYMYVYVYIFIGVKETLRLLKIVVSPINDTT